MTMKREAALEKARELWRILSPHCDRIDIAGSIRRGRSVVKDIELLAIPKNETVRVVKEASLFGTDERDETRRVRGFGVAVRSLGRIVKGNPDAGRYIQIEIANGIEPIMVDLFLAHPRNWGYIMAIRTGSADFMRLVAARWTRHGYTGVDGMLTKDGRQIDLREEEDLFRLLMLKTPPPNKRELTAEGLKPWLQ